MITSNGAAGQGKPEVERASGQRDQQEQTQGEGVLLWTIHSSAPFTVSSLALLFSFLYVDLALCPTVDYFFIV